MESHLDWLKIGYYNYLGNLRELIEKLDVAENDNLNHNDSKLKH